MTSSTRYAYLTKFKPAKFLHTVSYLQNVKVKTCLYGVFFYRQRLVVCYKMLLNEENLEILASMFYQYKRKERKPKLVKLSRFFSKIRPPLSRSLQSLHCLALYYLYIIGPLLFVLRHHTNNVHQISRSRLIYICPI